MRHFAPTGHLLIYGQAGKDTIKLVAKTIPNSAIDQLFGGAEADWFWFSKSDKINSYTAGEAARFA